MRRLFSSSDRKSKKPPPIVRILRRPKPARDVPSLVMKSNEPNYFNVFGSEVHRGTLRPSQASLEVLGPTSTHAIPRLAHGLDRVLFNPGVHFLRDPRTKVYNFDPYLRTILPPDRFNFDALTPFQPAYEDEALLGLARERGARYVTSTSSISATLGTIYYCLSQLRPLNLACLSSAFEGEPRSFTALTRSPQSVLLRPHPGGLRSVMVEKAAVDSGTGGNVLMRLGHLLERMLTMSPTEFQRLSLDSPNPLRRRVDGDGEVYSYTHAGSILMRSQLDCHDPRLPRGTFDLKTRAVLPIRMDIGNYQRYTEYRLTSLQGLLGSFEREFYDMARSTLLKYSFQVRIGGMDGIFAAFHNTAEIFGFQYLSREAIDEVLFGGGVAGDAAYSLATSLYNLILDAVMAGGGWDPNEPVRLTFCLDRAGKVHSSLSSSSTLQKLNIYAEGFGPTATNVHPTDSYRPGGLCQYSLVCTSNIHADPLTDPDQWSLQYQLNKVPHPNHSEFLSARRFITNQGGGGGGGERSTGSKEEDDYEFLGSVTSPSGRLSVLPRPQSPIINNKPLFRSIFRHIDGNTITSADEGPIQTASWTYHR